MEMRNSSIIVILLMISLSFLSLNLAVKAQQVQQDQANPDLRFIPWGNQNGLNLSLIEPDVYLLRGSTGNETSGFVTSGLGYMGNFISVALGEVDVSNMDKNHQISLVLTVAGENSTGNKQKSYDIVLLKGMTDKYGWTDGRYYEDLNRYSVKLINLDEILEKIHDKYKTLNKVTISVDKNSTINSLYFSIKFFDDRFIYSKIFEIGRQ